MVVLTFQTGYNGTICTDGTNPARVDIFFLFDHWGSDISWDLVDNEDDTIVATGDGYGNGYGNDVHITECVPDSCYWLRIYDSHGDGICCVESYDFGYYQVWVDGQLATFQDPLYQSFEYDGDSLYFCTQMFSQYGSFSNNLTIEIDFDTRISISNVSDIAGSNDYEYASNDCYEYYIDTENAFYQSNTFSLYITDGCYLITMYDDTDTSLSDAASLIDTNHGQYTIYMNGKAAGYGGYYTQSETTLICTNPSHTSFCIDPDNSMCTNNSDIYVSNYQVGSASATGHRPLVNVIATSYKYWDNSGFYTYDTQMFGIISCYGVHSCHKISKSSSLGCDGCFSCSLDTDSFDYDNYIKMSQTHDVTPRSGARCGGIKSCQNLLLSLAWLGSALTDTFLTVNSVHGIDGGVVVDIDKTWVDSYYVMNNSLSCTNCKIILSMNEIYNATMHFYVHKFFSLYNAEIMCDYHEEYDFSNISFYCDSRNPIYLAHIDDYCYTSYNLEFIGDCTFINSTNQIDDNTLSLINETLELIHSIADEEAECDNNGNFTLDIGYPSFVDEDIINNIEFGNICCRGYRSCAVSSTLRTNLGNILCLGRESCAFCDIIWTDDSNSVSDTDENFGDIICGSVYSCIDSMMESSNRILCAAKYSCVNSVIIGAKKLICTTDACSDSVIRNVETIYFMDEQTDALIYTGGINTAEIYFKGANAGASIEYYCNNGDTCFINCDEYTCDSQTTVLYCYGKCFVKCSADAQEYSTECVNIRTSLSPSAAPTAAPTLTPTDQPTNNQLLTEAQVSLYFNYILIFVGIVSVGMILLGYCDSQYCHKNELFNIRALVTYFYYICSVHVCSCCF